MAVTLAVSASGEDSYYYSDDRQISLTPAADKVVIGFKTGEFGGFSELFMDYPELVDTLPPESLQDNYYICGVEDSTNIDSLLTALEQSSYISRAHNVFTNELGGTEAYADRLVIRRSEVMTDAAFDSLMDNYAVEITGNSLTRADVIYLRVTETAPLTVLETANRLYEEEGILYSHPMFLKRDYQLFDLPTDPYFPLQWNFYNTETYENG